MSSIGSVGGPSPLQYAYPVSEFSELTETETSSTWYSISDIEKRAHDDLIRSGALALLSPNINSATFVSNLVNFGNTFSVSNIDVKQLSTMSMEDLSRKLALAQQDMTTKFLDNWVEQEQKLAEMSKIDQKKFDRTYHDALIRLTHTRMQQMTNEQHQPTALPYIMILAAFTVDSTLITESTNHIGNIASLSTFASIPPSLVHELSGIANGLCTMGIAWAAPVAITLASLSPQTAGLDKDAAKAFAIALASLLANPEIDGLISTHIDEAVQAGLLSPDKAQGMIAAFKASLLIQATAMLYKAEYGGITREEIQAVIKGGTTLPRDDFLSTLAQLVQEQLQTMDPLEAERLIQDCTAQYDQSLPSQEPLANLIHFLSLWDPNIYQDLNIPS